MTRRSGRSDAMGGRFFSQLAGVRLPGLGPAARPRPGALLAPRTAPKCREPEEAAPSFESSPRAEAEELLELARSAPQEAASTGMAFGDLENLDVTSSPGAMAGSKGPGNRGQQSGYRAAGGSMWERSGERLR